MESGVRLVAYNAHYGDMRMPILARHRMCARMLLERPLAASTVFMVQEAGPYLYELLRRSKAHTAHYAEVPGGQMAVLVATTVIEVGVDVPNASLMVIEHAERFGLAQLHQLRGRVGRGTAASVCVLLYTAPLSDTAKARLKAMAETNDGFEIARRDLDIRGPGEFLGARQSGDALLRFADLQADGALLQQARRVAARLLAEQPEAAAAHVARWLASRTEFLKA